VLLLQNSVSEHTGWLLQTSRVMMAMLEVLGADQQKFQNSSGFHGGGAAAKGTECKNTADI
jgi:hypothetical protein